MLLTFLPSTKCSSVRCLDSEFFEFLVSLPLHKSPSLVKTNLVYGDLRRLQVGIEMMGSPLIATANTKLHCDSLSDTVPSYHDADVYQTYSSIMGYHLPAGGKIRTHQPHPAGQLHQLHQFESLSALLQTGATPGNPITLRSPDIRHTTSGMENRPGKSLSLQPRSLPTSLQSQALASTLGTPPKGNPQAATGGISSSQAAILLMDALPSPQAEAAMHIKGSTSFLQGSRASSLTDRVRSAVTLFSSVDKAQRRQSNTCGILKLKATSFHEGGICPRGSTNSREGGLVTRLQEVLMEGGRSREQAVANMKVSPTSTSETCGTDTSGGETTPKADHWPHQPEVRHPCRLHGVQSSSKRITKASTHPRLTTASKVRHTLSGGMRQAGWGQRRRDAMRAAFTELRAVLNRSTGEVSFLDSKREWADVLVAVGERIRTLEAKRKRLIELQFHQMLRK